MKRASASSTSVSHSTVTIDRFTADTGVTYDVIIKDIKAPRAAPAPKTTTLKNPTSTTALLGGKDTTVDANGNDINNMYEWVVARLAVIPGDEIATSEAISKMANFATGLVEEVKVALRREAKVGGINKLHQDNMISYFLPDILHLGDEPLDEYDRVSLRIPYKLIVKNSDIDESAAEYLGVVLGNYMEDQFLTPTVERVRFAQRTEIKGTDVETTRKVLAEQS